MVVTVISHQVEAGSPDPMSVTLSLRWVSVMPRISKLTTFNNSWTSRSLLTRPLTFKWPILRFLSTTNCQKQLNGSISSWISMPVVSLVVVAEILIWETVRVCTIWRQGGQTQSKETIFWRTLQSPGLTWPDLMWHHLWHWSQFTALWFCATVLEEMEHFETFMTRIRGNITTNKETSLLKTAIRISIVANPQV